MVELPKFGVGEHVVISFGAPRKNGLYGREAVIKKTKLIDNGWLCYVAYYRKSGTLKKTWYHEDYLTKKDT